ncbi:hypothetical protein BGZ63DRAFT_381407 [Mariannaea sp. PMI_226]|nr:hypothetical protein BGZ63DRAFT_381407 [Mariannaea sp. PMI_226]
MDLLLFFFSFFISCFPCWVLREWTGKYLLEASFFFSFLFLCAPFLLFCPCNESRFRFWGPQEIWTSGEEEREERRGTRSIPSPEMGGPFMNCSSLPTNCTSSNVRR